MIISSALLIACVIAALSFGVKAESEDSAIKANCMIRHLKGKDRLDAKYPEFTITNPIESCDMTLRETEEDIYRDIALNVRKQTKFNKLTACVMSDLRKLHYAEDEMLNTIYLVDISMPEDEKRPKLAQINRRITKTLENSLSTCMFEKHFGAVYDALSTPSATNVSERSHETLVNSYCVRKHLFDKKLVIESVFDGAGNLNVEGVNCSAIVKEATKLIEAEMMKLLKDDDFELTDLQAKCALSKFRNAHFANKFLAVTVMSDYVESDDKKFAERASFIKSMIKLFNSAGVCDH